MPRNAFAHAGCCALRGICRCAFDSFRGFRHSFLADLGAPAHHGDEPRPRLERPPATALQRPAARRRDRKSTRLNSSHEWISYAVFCLKKKKKNQIRNKSTAQHVLAKCTSSGTEEPA